MIKVEISNVKGLGADCNIEIRGSDQRIFNELVQLFIRLLSNDETATILIDSLEISREIIHDKNK